MAIEYPKIQTLWKRDERFKVVPDILAVPEATLIKGWIVTEKIDGMNVRVILHPDGSVDYAGRTDRAQMPAQLLAHLDATFTLMKLQAAFERNEDGTWPEVVLFGEGYGPKIQSGGIYRADVSFRLFDVRVGDWWLEWPDVQNVAYKLGIKTAPQVGTIGDLVRSRTDLAAVLGHSIVAHNDGGDMKALPEGIVCRTFPTLLDRRGNRVMWKLKYKDF